MSLSTHAQDCPIDVIRSFNDASLVIVRKNLPPETEIFIADMFNASRFDDGYWRTAHPGGDDGAHGDNFEYANTLLDSHYYHVFNDEPRGFTPKQVRK